ncbi:MAG: beta-propeller domain-containing protein [Candidatus Bathyarchaeia archaeon]
MKLANLYPIFFPSRRKIVASGLIAFIGGVLLGALLLSLTPMSPSFNVFGQPLSRFTSYDELVSFVNTSSGYQYPYYSKAWDVVRLAAEAMPSASVDYSRTNIQVAGVDEADIVKTDGEYLYVVSNRTIFIVRVYPVEDAQVVSQIELEAALHGIFINEDGDKLVVFGASSYGTMLTTTWGRPYYWPYSTPRSFIYVYNVTDRASPVLARNVTLDGSYFSSRMIGNYVYAVIIEPTWVNGSEIKLPVMHFNDAATEVLATEIYYSNVIDYGYSFTTIIAVNVENDAEEPTHETILIGTTSDIYVSLNNIYITLQGAYDASGEIERTLIYRISLEGGNIESQASGEVRGRVLNQFSMDEYDGYFRVATTTGSLWGGESQNHVYVLNMSLGIVGRLEGLAPRESIYSARFMGDKFYLVTFRNIDPLFVIDLQNPENPYVLGELKITGYSDYLHFYDEKHVIGVGKETVAAEWDDFAWYQGVKISLFNVSDPLNPTEIDKVEIGDRGTDSPVLRDHKAFLFDKERQLLIIPVLVAEIDSSKYPSSVPPYTFGDYVWQGVYIYNITLHGLEFRGNITHIDNEVGLQSNYYYYSPYSVKRALYIDNVLYTISDRRVKMTSIDSLKEILTIDFP